MNQLITGGHHPVVLAFTMGIVGLAAGTPPGFPSLVAPAAAPRALDGAAPLAALGLGFPMDDNANESLRYWTV